MVATPDEVLPLAQAKGELRIPDSEEGHDALIVGHRDAAVRYVEQHTGRHLLDAVVERWLPFRPDCTAPVDFGFLPDARQSGHAVEYYPTGGPSLVDGTALIGAGEVYRPYRFRLWPATEWPGSAWPGRDARWLVRVGAEVVDQAFTAATVLLMRALYDGVPVLRVDAAVDRLLAPYAVVR